ncbi:hypothetical protein QEH56_24225 [Pelagicoccus enzymogenes]|uniref:hypothetical protein n=1 Tax=Pelagicoccus enzymogenes TaxID=2773457 RepID=UPI00280F9E87|nr:hypothetical protein [Pelagicoccus enzymogenes]MDQ8201289.1 hypothetical protein [Pelagicoccus enzymogenes]
MQKTDEKQKHISMTKRIIGTLCGAVAGLVLATLVYFLLSLELELLDGRDENFYLAIKIGAPIGAVLGWIYPRIFMVLGTILGSLIPGL